MTGEPIAIVGSGIAGLVAAAHIAAAGLEAVVFEAGSTPGGRARTRVRDGFHFNQGPHALYVGGSLAAALREFDVPVSGGSPDLAAGRALWEDWSSPLPIARRGQDLDMLDRDAVIALQAFFERLAHDADLGRGMAVSSVLEDLPAQTRKVIEALIRLSTYVHAPTEFDAKAAFDQLRLSQRGTIYVDGGWSNLIDGLLNSAVFARVSMRQNAPVERVRSLGGGSGVELQLANGSTERFGAVILAVPPKAALSLVVSSAHLASEVERMRPVRVMCLDLALSKLPRENANFALGMDAPTYFSIHSAVSKLAPPGGALIHAARYLAPHEMPSVQHFEELEGLVDGLQPGWRHHLEDKQRLSGMTVAYDYPTWTGNGRRIGAPLHDCPGTFLAGDWVGPVDMLADAAATSARTAAESVVQYLGI